MHQMLAVDNAITLVNTILMTSVNSVEASTRASRGEQEPRRRKRETLTNGEREVLAALKRAIREHGQPTVREIAALAGSNHYAATVHRNLKRLAEKGYVEMTRKFRGVRLVRRTRKVTQ